MSSTSGQERNKWRGHRAFFPEGKDVHLRHSRPLALGSAMTSIVIAAHNKEAVIGRCLDALLANAAPASFDMTMVANGCTDATAHIAATRTRVQVLDLVSAGKTGALNEGDAVAVGFPRIYLDADIVITAAGVRALSDTLSGSAAAPRRARWPSPPVARSTPHTAHCLFAPTSRSTPGCQSSGMRQSAAASSRCRRRDAAFRPVPRHRRGRLVPGLTLHRGGEEGSRLRERELWPHSARATCCAACSGAARQRGPARRADGRRCPDPGPSGGWYIMATRRRAAQPRPLVVVGLLRGDHPHRGHPCPAPAATWYRVGARRFIAPSGPPG